jgi:flagellar basal body P-ring formation protein FlgA
MALAHVMGMNRHAPASPRYSACSGRIAALFILVSSAMPGAEAAPGPEAVPAASDIRAVAEQVVREQLQVSVTGSDRSVFVTAGVLDPRLRLTPCTVALHGLLPPAAQWGARVTVGVRCSAPAWTVYVPVQLETQLQVLVLRQAAARNSTLRAEDVAAQMRRVPGLATSYITRLDQLAHHHLRVTAPPGAPLTIDMFVADVLVKRGQRVTLIARAGGIEVRAQGEAIADASTTGRIRVLNLTTRRVVEGQVESADLVRVGL